MQIVLLAIIIGYSAVGKACPREYYHISDLSSYEKQLIVDVHNKLRQAVALGAVKGQPAAENMREFKWDEGLAADAQRWAVTCSSSIHDEARHKKNMYVGQNIATFWTTKVPSSLDDMSPDFYKDAINKWFNENDYFHFGGSSWRTVGHYTQMIWAETHLIGCGFSFYYDHHKRYTKKYVCNYGPSGNIASIPPYKKGYPNCYKNGLQNSRKYMGLCDMSYNYFHPFNHII